MPPSDETIARECLARKLRMLNRAVTSAYDDALRPHGIKVSQMNVLVAVSVLEPTPQAALTEALMMEKSTVSRNLDRMIDNGWVAVEEADDGRANSVTLTSAGRTLLDGAKPAWAAAQKRVKATLGPESVGAIEAMVRALGQQGG